MTIDGVVSTKTTILFTLGSGKYRKHNQKNHANLQLVVFFKEFPPG